MNIADIQHKLVESTMPILSKSISVSADAGKTVLQMKAGESVLNVTADLIFSKMPGGKMLQMYVGNNGMSNSVFKLIIAQMFMMGLAGMESSIPSDKRKYIDMSMQCMALAAFKGVADNSGIDKLVDMLITPEVRQLVDDAKA
jgi:hypothetical protein